jgi:hypothetical protein
MMGQSRKLYVYIGCGFCTPIEWRNYDASLILRFEKIPIIGRLYTKNYRRFPNNVEYGDIIKGLHSIKEDSCEGILFSHVLEQAGFKIIRECAYYSNSTDMYRFSISQIQHYVSEAKKQNLSWTKGEIKR